MKKFILGWLIFMSLGIFSMSKMKWHPFVENNTKSEITLRYKNSDKRIEIEQYATLESVLENIEIPDDVDLNILNPLQILNHNDLVILPIIKEHPCVSLNTGTLEELMTLKGVGEAIAKRIIAYRETQGLFQGIDDIKNVKGIGPKVFEKLKDAICI